MGFLIALMLIFNTFGTLSFSAVFEEAPAVLGTGLATGITLMLLLGAAAQAVLLHDHLHGAGVDAVAFQGLAELGLDHRVQGHLLGTDDTGRDVLARIVHGCVVAITVGVVAMVIATLIGVILGI